MGEPLRPSGMRRSASLLLALAALLAACSYQPFIGGDPSVPPSASPDEPVGTQPSSPGPLPSGDGSVRETPNPDVVEAHQTGIDHYAIGPDGRTVVVYYWGGTQACFGLQKVDVGTDPSGITVLTVFEGTLPGAVGQACTMEALLKSTVVTLDTAIVVDAAQPDAPAGEPQIAPDAEEVDIVGGVENPIPVAVTGYHLSGDGATLTVHFFGGVPECYGVASASLDTSEQPWTVSLSEGHIPGAEVCIEIALAKTFAFTLDSQLIRDGSLTG
jgi:hypothetical protein